MTRLDLSRLHGDVAALAEMTRGSASPGERRSAEWIAARLRGAGVAGVRLETFRYQSTYAWVHALHVAAGLALSRRRGPHSRALTLAALVSLELEASGRNQWLRRLLPAAEGTNVVARIPASDTPLATLVLVAHHDAARTGVSWDPRLVALGARPGAMPPRLGPVGVGLILAALPGLRRLGRALLWAALASYVDIATSPTVPGANDNATGVAALLALAGALSGEPLTHTDVVLLAPGCEESGMGGMAAWLKERSLDGERTLVVCLDTLGSGTPIVLEAEAALLAHAYRPQDLALAQAGAARAGVDPPRRWRAGAWTDAVLARFADLPALSLLSVGPDGVYTEWHQPTDTPDRVDFASVEHSTRLALGIAREFDARASVT